VSYAFHDLVNIAHLYQFRILDPVVQKLAKFLFPYSKRNETAF